MLELPRSRALVRLDGPGHIMPVEPVTPPGSAVWRVVHSPAALGVVAAGLLYAAVLSLKLAGVGFRLVDHMPGVRYLVPPLGAAAVVAAYWVFVRAVERRPAVDELGAGGGGAELGFGVLAGLALSAATFGALALLGDVRVLGANPPRVLAHPVLVELCTAVVLEVLANGLAFRLAERPMGSWWTLALTAVAFGAVPFTGRVVTGPAVLAVTLFGLACAAAYMATRRLWAPIGLFAAWNVAQTALYGAALGVDGPQGLVLTQVEGPNWLTGGLAGTDASAPALVGDALLVLALLTLAVRRGRIVRPAWRRGRRG